MAQKNWQTVLADNLEGGVSTEKALTDIKRGMMLNLFHECIGLSMSATPKYVSGINTYTGTGVVAFDKIQYLPWRDFKPVAEGKEVMVPHVGNVDTIQIPIDQMWYFSVELMSTDLTRMQQQAIYRAQIIGQKTRTLAVTLDCEFFDLLIAAAAGQKGGITQTKFPKSDYLNPVKFNYYKLYSEVGTELETQITPYKVGASRKELVCVIDPRAYTELIAHFKGEAILIERVLEFIKNEQITPTRITRRL